MNTNNLRKILTLVILMVSNFALTQTQLFMDDYNAQSLDVTNKWRRGDNSASSVSIVNGLLQLNLIDGEAA